MTDTALLLVAADLLDRAASVILLLERSAPPGTRSVNVMPMHHAAAQLRTLADCRDRQTSPVSLPADDLRSLADWAAAHDVPPRTATDWARKDRLPGAARQAGRWWVPSATEPPPTWRPRRTDGTKRR